MANTKVKWESANAKWEKSPGDQDILGSESLWTWSDVTLLEDLIGQGAGEEEIAYHVHQLEPNKKKRFVKLVCKVKGLETYSGQKTIKNDIKISADDIRLVYKEVLGIDLAVENIQI
mgnify:CR=1 FL=1|tara:strand:+ start:758 stop:1108 length:351 start_codon:yes stop_codon:yes gene_type:complete